MSELERLALLVADLYGQLRSAQEQVAALEQQLQRQQEED